MTPVSGLCFNQIRDITGNPEWERAYQYEIPVLAKVLSDGSEVSIHSGLTTISSSLNILVYLIVNVDYEGLKTKKIHLLKNANESLGLKSLL